MDAFAPPHEVIKDLLRKSDIECVATLIISHHLLAFKGHFPSQPILPGIVQLRLIRHVASLFLRLPLRLQKVHKAKWRKLVVPGDTLECHMQLLPIEESPSSNQIAPLTWNAKVSLTCEGRQVTQAQLLFTHSLSSFSSHKIEPKQR